MIGRDESFGKKISAVVFAVSLYWTTSISMVFINKYLLSSKELKFDAPIFVTWYQCLTSLGICALLAFISEQRPRLLTYPTFKIDIQVAKEIVPLSLMFVGMITFNNLCLKYVSVSFYMVVRSLTTVFNVVMTYIFFGEKTSMRALVCCGIIILGFILGIDQENGLGSLTLHGVVFGVMASAFVALNAIYTKKSLPIVESNIWKLTMYNNFNACLIFLPFIFLFGEHQEVLNFPKLFDSYFWFAMTVSGVLGFSMSYVTSLQIQVTSPLSHNVSGTAKAYAQTLIAVFYYNEIKSMLWWLSNLLVLIGAALYSHVRTQEMKDRHNKGPSKDQLSANDQKEAGEAKEALLVAVTSPSAADDDHDVDSKANK